MAEKRFEHDQIDILGDGSVVIYKRADASKKGIWTARVKIPNGVGYAKKSTRQRDEQLARVFALELRDEMLVQSKLGLNAASGSFEDVYLKWWKSTEHRKTEKRRTQQLNEAKRYFFPYFDQVGKKFSLLQDDDVEGFWAWRRAFWTTGEGAKILAADRKRIARGANAKRVEKGKARLSPRGNIAEVPSQKSVEIAASHLREVWRWAVKNRYAKRVLEIDAQGQGRVERKGSGSYGAADSRRGWFSPDEYRRLTTHLRSWVKGASNERLNERHLYGRRLLRDLFLFLCNSGLRTGEAKSLRWRNVRLNHSMSDGTVADLLELTEGKTGGRLVVIRDEAGKVLRRRLKETTFVDPEDFVFCSMDGGSHPDVGKVFVQLLEELDLRTDEFGNKRTLYSCRHQYATFRMMYGVEDGMTIDELAQNMGTSVAYIQKHYSHKRVTDVAGKLVGRKK